MTVGGRERISIRDELGKMEDDSSLSYIIIRLYRQKQRSVFPHNYVEECEAPMDEDKPSLPRRTRKFDSNQLNSALRSLATKEEISTKEDEQVRLIKKHGRKDSETGAYTIELPDVERTKRTMCQQIWDGVNLFGCCGEEAKHEKPKQAKPLRFTLWAHNMGNYAALFLIVGGVFAEYWAHEGSDSKAKKHSNTGLGAYSILAGLVVALFEYFCGLKRPLGVYERNGIPARSVLQLILAIPAFFTVPTILGAAMLTGAAVANFAASSTNEYGDQSVKANKRRKKAAKKAGDDDPFGLLEDIGEQGCCARVNHILGRLKESDYLGQAILSLVYWFINVLLFVVYYSINLDAADTLSDWLPGAKAFAGVLNFNMAIVIVPVTRTFLQWLNHQAASDSCFSWLKYLPLRKNIVFHKIIAFVVLIAAIGHIVCHLGNWAEAASATTLKFGKARIYIIWITGVIMAVAQFFLYVFTLLLFVLHSHTHSLTHTHTHHTTKQVHGCSRQGSKSRVSNFLDQSSHVYRISWFYHTTQTRLGIVVRDSCINVYVRKSSKISSRKSSCYSERSEIHQTRT